MGVDATRASAFVEMARGALWAIPVIGVTAVVVGVLLAIFPVMPVSPLPPTGEPRVRAVAAGRGLVAPFGEEIRSGRSRRQRGSADSGIAEGWCRPRWSSPSPMS